MRKILLSALAIIALTAAYKQLELYLGRGYASRAGALTYNCSSSSSIVQNPYSMGASITNISSGTCTITLTTGYFSNFPNCTGNYSESTTGGVMVNVMVDSATSIRVRHVVDTGSAPTNPGGNVICMGPP